MPADNPMNEAKVALGAQLFADPRLSMNGQFSCQSCHAPERAFTDGRARSRGVTGAALELNAPTLFNVAYSASLGWNDAGVRTLEQQMRGPMFNEHPPELGLAGREARLEQELAADPAIAPAFATAFPDEPRPVSMENVIRAIAAYERTLLAGGSAFDRYVFGGEHQALDAAQKRGMELFFSPRAGCSSCHGGINFAGPWIDREQPAAASGVRRHRHRASRCGFRPCAISRPRRLTCTTGASPRSVPCSTSTNGSRPTRPPIRACGARH